MTAEPILCTLAARPAHGAAARDLGARTWPRFLQHADVRRWGSLFDRFADWQILMLDEEGGLLAVGHTVPLRWSGHEEDLPRSIDEIVHRAHVDLERWAEPTTLSAVAAIVRPGARGRGLSKLLVSSMVSLAERAKLRELIAPVRPTSKQEHPHVPMEEYLSWKQASGLPFDPWVRVHARLGAATLGLIPKAMTVEGSVAEWEEWTGLRFPISGAYEVPGALVPVRIDLEKGRGLYEEPNVWMLHRVPRRVHVLGAPAPPKAPPPPRPPEPWEQEEAQ
jgi:hypothetical protein